MLYGKVRFVSRTTHPPQAVPLPSQGKAHVNHAFGQQTDVSRYAFLHPTHPPQAVPLPSQGKASVNRAFVDRRMCILYRHDIGPPETCCPTSCMDARSLQIFIEFFCLIDRLNKDLYLTLHNKKETRGSLLSTGFYIAFCLINDRECCYRSQ